MCIRKLNVYALGALILVLSTCIGKCQSRNSFDSKHDYSDFHESDDTSSDSKEVTDPDTEKSLLNSKDNEQSRSEEILKGGHKNKKKPDKDDKHSNSNNDNASRESDGVIRGNLKTFNKNVRYFNNSVTENNNLSTDAVVNDSNKKEEILLGGPKSNSNEYVKLGYKDLTTKNHLHLENTERFIEEDEVIRGNPKTVSYENFPPKRDNLKTSTYLNIEDLSKDDDIIIGNSGKGIGNIPSVNEKTRNDNKTIENMSKDEVVLGKGKINESGDGIILNLHLTNNRPRLTITRNDKNPVSKWSSSEDDEVMLRDIKRVKALRKVYGDACVRVVLKKCFTALKKTLKEVCQSGDKKCKRNFKEEFRDNAIAGCYMKFNHKSISRVGNEDPMVEDSRDNGRQLSMACMHVLGNRTEGTAADHKSDTVNAETKNVYILRDRYEKACQKATYTKCKAAGNYARDKTCAKYECSKIKKKAIKQTYKKNCRSAYGYFKGSDSE